MLDLKKALIDLQALRLNCANRRVQIDLDELVRRSDIHGQQVNELQSFREQQNKIATSMKARLSDEQKKELILQGRLIKEKISELTEIEQKSASQVEEMALQLPNWSHPQSPVGDEGEGRTIKRWGNPPSFSKTPLDHLEIGKKYRLFDFEAATAVAGSKFVFLQNQAVLLEQALIQMALNTLASKGFTLFSTPDLARRDILQGLGFNPRGTESQIYSLKDSDLCLIGTAEITLGGMLRNRLFKKKDLPHQLAGLSHCFRTEAGAHGKDNKGLYRLHQFTKVEMFVAINPEDSDEHLMRLVEIQEEILQNLELPYRIVEIPTGDLGGPAYRKFDIEVWMPSRGPNGDWGEVTSASNCTDYQSRRLKIRYKDEGKPEFAHTLNATAIAISRILMAILENGQQENGSIAIPAKLAELCGFSRIQSGEK